MSKEIRARELKSRLAAGKPTHLVDVRDPWERAIAKLNDQQYIPLDELPERVSEVRPPEGTLVVIYCHHGVRSLAAAEFLEQQGLKGVVSLAGGIDAWAQLVDPKIPVY
jgi:adenylyltransferase/sulfurtransferase